MAEKINIEIDLEGGAEVEKQLADIGKAGQQAFGDIQNAADQIDLSSATDALNNVQTAVQGAATFEKIVQSIGRVQGAFDSLGNAASKMATRMTRSLGAIGVAARALGPVGIALGVAAGAFVKFGDDSADAINKLTAAGASLDLTAQQFDRVQKALTQAGVAPDAILPGLQKLKETLAGDFFPTDVITGLQRFIAQLESMPDGVARTQLAMQTLGESLGAQIIAGLQTGTITAQNFATALGLVTPVTQQQIVEAAKYQQALNQLSAAWNELKAAFAPITTPILGFLTDEIKQFIQDLKQLRLEFALAKAAWDIFVAGITGKDVGEAARKAVEDYKKLEAQLKQTATTGTQNAAALGNAAAQSSQQMIRGADGVVRAEETLAQKHERIRAAQSAANAAMAAEEQQQAQAHADAQNRRAQAAEAAAARIKAAQDAIDAQHAAETAQALAQAYQRAGQAGAAAGLAIAQAMNTGAQATGNYLITLRGVIVLLEGVTQAAAKAAQFIGNLPRPTTIPFQRPDALAAGGLLGGRGTGTSDSNLAWVSRGEHIMPARAVAQPGVLSFLEALRRSGGNLRGVLDGMNRFALGGLVPRSLPAFAGGGPVGSMSHVTIQFPGLPAINGLRASSDVVGELQRAAALAQVRSGGRKPSRYS